MADKHLRADRRMLEQAVGVTAANHDVVHRIAVKPQTARGQSWLAGVAGKNPLHSPQANMHVANIHGHPLTHFRQPVFARLGGKKIHVAVTVPIAHKNPALRRWHFQALGSKADGKIAEA